MKSVYSSSFISSSVRGTYHRSNPSCFSCCIREPCHLATNLMELPNTKISLLVTNTHDGKSALGMLNDEFVGRDETTNNTSTSSNKTDKAVFDAEDWLEISKPENYISYSNKLRQSRLKSALPSKTKARGQERRIVLFLLLGLFVPIFSIELFFALSRQFICGNFLSRIDDEMWLTDYDRAVSSLKGISPWATYLCSPHLDHLI